MTYEEFLQSKSLAQKSYGLREIPDLNPDLFDFQRDIVRWALRRGRAAIFADCGMGKTPMQLEWANHIPGRILIVAPLAVAQQTEREGGKFGIHCRYLREDDHRERIVITNYEMLDRFDADSFAGVVLDESSILKSYMGKTKIEIISKFENTRYKLACTATPAPNDFMELGNHSEFLGVMRGSEMLSAFFINDPAHVGKYRIKGHAETPFWEWISGWAVMLRKPSDLGYEDRNFILPPLTIEQAEVVCHKAADGMLFPMEAHTLLERLSARRVSVGDRARKAGEIINTEPGEQWLAWCNLNSEAESICDAVPDAVNVQGSDSREHKERSLLKFQRGEIRVLVSKPTICGFGMNMQNCARMAFVGLSDSYEQFYQALRRCWRFGQTREVVAHVITSEVEGAVVANIQRKEEDAKRMTDGMVRHMSHISKGILRGANGYKQKYCANGTFQIPSFLHDNTKNN